MKADVKAEDKADDEEPVKVDKSETTPKTDFKEPKPVIKTEEAGSQKENIEEHDLLGGESNSCLLYMAGLFDVFKDEVSVGGFLSSFTPLHVLNYNDMLLQLVQLVACIFQW